jgi:hypothetical protein
MMAEKEYIEREKALSAQNKAMNLSEMRERLKRIPAADVRPVVQCRDCKSYNKPRLGFCETHLVRMHRDDFCSYGKKREEN